jgi:hypothetical protein
MIRGPQLESERFISPLSSEAFDQLLRRAAAYSTLGTVRLAGAKCGAESAEFAPIGETAGALWHMLSDGGPTTFATLIDAIGVPESLFFMAVGWLARENKITIEPHNGDYEIRLK